MEYIKSKLTVIYFDLEKHRNNKDVSTMILRQSNNALLTISIILDKPILGPQINIMNINEFLKQINSLKTHETLRKFIYGCRELVDNNTVYITIFVCNSEKEFLEKFPEAMDMFEFADFDDYSTTSMDRSVYLKVLAPQFITKNYKLLKQK